MQQYDVKETIDRKSSVDFQSNVTNGSSVGKERSDDDVRLLGERCRC